MRILATGADAAALGAILARPGVVAGFPITPATPTIELLADKIEKGELAGRFVRAESEHSVMAVLVGAAATGARTFTATSSQGLAYMHEMLHWASGMRLPIVMVDASRGLGAPWCLYSEQTDSLAQRDTGWIQIYCETAQETLDTVLQAYRIAEAVLLPVMVVMDGFFTSHVSEPIDLPDAGEALAFAPHRPPPLVIDTAHPLHFGAASDPETILGLRHALQRSMDDAVEVIDDSGKEFGQRFGRAYGLVDGYRMEEAEVALVTAGSAAGTARSVVDEMREQGAKLGLTRLRVFRPFPWRAIARRLRHLRRVVVVERDLSPGLGGIFAAEIRTALHRSGGGGPEIIEVIAGLGGVDITQEDLRRISRAALERTAAGRQEEPILWTHR